MIRSSRDDAIAVICLCLLLLLLPLTRKTLQSNVISTSNCNKWEEEEEEEVFFFIGSIGKRSPKTSIRWK